MADDDKLPDPLTPTEIAAHERLPYKTVVGWCERGQLKAYQVGTLWRVRRADFLAFRRHNKLVPGGGASMAVPRKPKVGGPSRQRAADDYLDRVGV